MDFSPVIYETVKHNFWTSENIEQAALIGGAFLAGMAVHSLFFSSSPAVEAKALEKSKQQTWEVANCNCTPDNVQFVFDWNLPYLMQWDPWASPFGVHTRFWSFI